MRLSKEKSKIIGLQLAELNINLIDRAVPSIAAKYILLTETHETFGPITKVEDWTEQAQEAINNCIAALEDDGVKVIFDVGTTIDSNDDETSQI